MDAWQGTSAGGLVSVYWGMMTTARRNAGMGWSVIFLSFMADRTPTPVRRSSIESSTSASVDTTFAWVKRGQRSGFGGSEVVERSYPS